MVIATGKPSGPVPLGRLDAKKAENAKHEAAETPEEERREHETGEGAVTAEALNYRSEEERCGTCEYGKDGQCQILKMAVPDGASCNAHQFKSEEDEGEYGEQEEYGE